MSRLPYAAVSPDKPQLIVERRLHHREALSYGDDVRPSERLRWIVIARRNFFRFKSSICLSHPFSRSAEIISSVGSSASTDNHINPVAHCLPGLVSSSGPHIYRCVPGFRAQDGMHDSVHTFLYPSFRKDPRFRRESSRNLPPAGTQQQTKYLWKRCCGRCSNKGER